jgi:hypothetical protein
MSVSVNANSVRGSSGKAPTNEFTDSRTGKSGSSNGNGHSVTIRVGRESGGGGLNGISVPSRGGTSKGYGNRFRASSERSGETNNVDHIFFVWVSYYYNLLPVLMLLKCNFD